MKGRFLDEALARGLLPDWMIRVGIRRLNRQRLRSESAPSLEQSSAAASGMEIPCWKSVVAGARSRSIWHGTSRGAESRPSQIPAHSDFSLRRAPVQRVSGTCGSSRLTSTPSGPGKSSTGLFRWKRLSTHAIMNSSGALSNGRWLTVDGESLPIHEVLFGAVFLLITMIGTRP